MRGAAPSAATAACDVVDLGPVVAGLRRPGRAAETQQRHAGARAGCAALPGHLRGEGMRRVDHGVDALGRADRPPAPRRRRSRRCGQAIGGQRGVARCGRPATARRRDRARRRARGPAPPLPSCRRGSGPASARRSSHSRPSHCAARPRTSMAARRVPHDRPQRHPGRWLAIVGIGEDGLDGLSPAARAARLASRDRLRRRAPSRAVAG